MVAVCPSYIQDARFLKVNTVNSAAITRHFDLQTKYPSTHVYTYKPFSLLFSTQHAPTVVVRISETLCVSFMFFVDNIARNTEQVVKYIIITVKSTPHKASEIRGALMDTLQSCYA
jgi:hypothetical protein